jgi:hypothetical protein
VFEEKKMMKNVQPIICREKWMVILNAFSQHSCLFKALIIILLKQHFKSVMITLKGAHQL